MRNPFKKYSHFRSRLDEPLPKLNKYNFTVEYRDGTVEYHDSDQMSNEDFINMLTSGDQW